MNTTVDACGRSCPEPVLMTKNAIASGEKQVEVLVDNRTAVQNVTRFAQQAGYAVDVQEDSGVFHLKLSKQ